METCEGGQHEEVDEKRGRSMGDVKRAQVLAQAGRLLPCSLLRPDAGHDAHLVKVQISYTTHHITPCPALAHRKGPYVLAC